jgi:hypothetical protein
MQHCALEKDPFPTFDSMATSIEEKRDRIVEEMSLFDDSYERFAYVIEKDRRLSYRGMHVEPVAGSGVYRWALSVSF